MSHWKHCEDQQKEIIPCSFSKQQHQNNFNCLSLVTLCCLTWKECLSFICTMEHWQLTHLCWCVHQSGFWQVFNLHWRTHKIPPGDHLISLCDVWQMQSVTARLKFPQNDNDWVDNSCAINGHKCCCTWHLTLWLALCMLKWANLYWTGAEVHVWQCPMCSQAFCCRSTAQCDVMLHCTTAAKGLWTHVTLSHVNFSTGPVHNCQCLQLSEHWVPELQLHAVLVPPSAHKEQPQKCSFTDIDDVGAEFIINHQNKSSAKQWTDRSEQDCWFQKHDGTCNTPVWTTCAVTPHPIPKFDAENPTLSHKPETWTPTKREVLNMRRCCTSLHVAVQQDGSQQQHVTPIVGPFLSDYCQ